MSRPLQHIDAIYVLSVKKFTDRIAHIKQELHQHDLGFEFIFDHDLGEISSDLEKIYFGQSPCIQPPQRSLVLKHIQAWKYCVEKKYKSILVFEDDIILDKFFKSEIKDVMDAAMRMCPGYLIFLGGADTKVPPSFFTNKHKLIEIPIATADGYVTDYTACQKRILWLENNQVILPADHLLKMIDKHVGIKQYWSYKPLVQQGSVFGMFTSSLDGNRRQKSNLQNLLRYRFKIITRRVIPGFFYRIKAWIQNNGVN